MPAEIDTGGPTVLHCDYRADCPIPIVTSAETVATINVRQAGVSRIDGDRRVGKSKLVTATHRSFRRRNVPLSLARGSRVSDDDDRSTITTETRKICCWRRSENKREEEEEEEERRSCWCANRPWTTGGIWPRYGIARRVRIGKSTRFSSQPGDTDRRCEEELVVPCLAPSLAEERRTGKEVEYASAVRSGESRVAKVAAASCTDSLSFERRGESLARKQRRRRACTATVLAAPRRSTYVQLALLLFLVAFGQCGLRKWPSAGINSHRYCARPSTAVGLSVLAIGTVISAVSAAPVDLTGDAGVRAERSANLSHITGASRKIQMYIKNRHLQILPDGTVNGSNHDTSDYTIFQRTSVSRGQLRIQGVATCLYLCMDSCGLLYGSREYTDDCVFNETLEQHNYNTYSSAKWSTARKTLYLGLNRRGQPRRVQAKGHNLGRLSAYARVLTQVAPSERVEALQRRLLGAQHNVRHRHNSHRGDLIQQSLCPSLPVQEKDGRDKFRCRKRKKRKKRKRRCRPGEKPGPQCQTTDENATVPARNDGLASNGTRLETKRSCEGAASDEACRREALSVPSRKRKLRVDQAKKEEREGGGGDRNVTVARNVTGDGRGVVAASTNDGKKRKKKGSSATAARRNSTVALAARKRFTPGGAGTTSALPTTTTVASTTFATSSSSWSSPGTSTDP
ncbi:hypothetical protein QLX08_010445 [Tetragonisca angustula]|uniref:Fibroblast growth factor n=1 Tax=Tetragonisca angustula TaxID=166442 RepID=A0AAW0ZDH3_9HYME